MTSKVIDIDDNKNELTRKNISKEVVGCVQDMVGEHDFVFKSNLLSRNI